MLEARDLHCERDERTLFRGLSFTVEAGEWVQVTGGNGAGKTTLLRLLTGLARPDGGEVYWQGEPLRRVRDMVAPSGEGAVRCMQMAMHGVDTPIDYLNSHGTSTPVGDVKE
ncbi:ATP-binding cassette domain-containing protein, partial [Salmonella enterica subsp. enterica serovar Anatum]|nr:ATP-binding cassette domain-containing protein [Salmonella enterica subsp. enterica serovar Anatum]